MLFRDCGIACVMFVVSVSMCVGQVVYMHVFAYADLKRRVCV